MIFNKLEQKYYKYVANWIKLSYEEQCEIPLLSFDEWIKQRKIDIKGKK